MQAIAKKKKIVTISSSITFPCRAYYSSSVKVFFTQDEKKGKNLILSEENLTARGISDRACGQ